jgi:hypothetical protein
MSTYRGSLILHQKSDSVISGFSALGSNISIEIENESTPSISRETVLRASVLQSNLKVLGSTQRLALEGQFDHSLLDLGSKELRIVDGSKIRGSTLNLSEGCQGLKIGTALGVAVDLRFSEILRVPLEQTYGFRFEIYNSDLRFSRIRLNVNQTILFNSDIAYSVIEPIYTSTTTDIDPGTLSAHLQDMLQKNNLSKKGVALLEGSGGTQMSSYDRRTTKTFQPGFCRSVNSVIECVSRSAIKHFDTAEFGRQLCGNLGGIMTSATAPNLIGNTGAPALLYETLVNSPSRDQSHDANKNRFRSAFESCAKQLPNDVERELLAYSRRIAAAGFVGFPR